MPVSLYDLSPLWRMLLMGVLIAAGPLLWVLLQKRRATPLGRLQALTVVTLFLTFDLVLFGAFTRLTDSGLGCPDWPGCYGSASPLGAIQEIAAAQTVMPTGPVTQGKAWVEMVHRYLATGVGVLITVLCVTVWLARNSGRRDQPRDSTALSPWWPTFTLVWVCIQGAFGALTVTMKLFPAIVSLHLLGGYGLLALLTVQAVLLRRGQHGLFPSHGAVAGAWPVSGGLRMGLWAALLLLLIQATSGAWVSTNYAVLACTEFPQCQGVWWPEMDFAGAFEIWRPLGFGKSGEHISFQALTAMHYSHRLLALVTALVLGALAWRLHALVGLRHPARWLGGLVALQLVTGLSNVVLGWPLVAAVLHTGGAGALVVCLIWLLTATRTHSAPSELRTGALAAPQPRFSE